MGKTHLIVSTGVTVSVLGMFGQDITLPVIAVSAVSALLPDIDEPNALLVSKSLPTPVVNVFKGLLVLFAIFIYFVGADAAPWNIALACLIAALIILPERSLRTLMMIVLGLVCIFILPSYSPWNYIVGCILIISAIVPHRGLTHTLYAAIGWAILLYYTTRHIHPNLWLAGGLSYFIHLFPCDTVTSRGIQPLPPLKWKWRLNLMTTGKPSGKIVEGASIIITFLLIWYVFFRENYFFT